MEYINIIKKLHEAFPEFDVETIIKILEVIKSEETYPWVISKDKSYITSDSKPYTAKSYNTWSFKPYNDTITQDSLPYTK